MTYSQSESNMRISELAFASLHQSPSLSKDRMWWSFLPEKKADFPTFVFTYPWKLPWNTIVDLFSLSDHTFKPTVGEGVAFVEVKMTLVVEETAASFW